MLQLSKEALDKHVQSMIDATMGQLSLDISLNKSELTIAIMRDGTEIHAASVWLDDLIDERARKLIEQI
jgi:hypothetical protein